MDASKLEVAGDFGKENVRLGCIQVDPGSRAAVIRPRNDAFDAQANAPIRERGMMKRHWSAISCLCGFMVLAVTGCATPDPSPIGTKPAADLPPSVGNGIGSQYGNYAAQIDGEMRGPDGERCVIFNWDRPLSQGRAIRLRSASCDSKERPGWMYSIELSRTIIPITESHLADETDPERP